MYTLIRSESWRALSLPGAGGRAQERSMVRAILPSPRTMKMGISATSRNSYYLRIPFFYNSPNPHRQARGVADVVIRSIERKAIFRDDRDREMNVALRLRRRLRSAPPPAVSKASRRGGSILTGSSPGQTLPEGQEVTVVLNAYGALCSPLFGTAMMKLSITSL